MADSFGVYVHIPFCARRCDYCAFATWTDRHHLHHRYAAACVAEIERARDLWPAATSVFFGGGTPSLIDPVLLIDILAAIPLAAGAEVTVECNPDTVTPALLGTYRAGGVNRLSFGVQSMVPLVLASLGRSHDAAGVERAVAWAKAEGFERFSLDLIYGAVGESITDWEATVCAALALDAPHISAYALTIEAGTPLAADPGRWPDDDDQADKYALADALFAAAGLGWYEISNWARPGHECGHNRLYWTAAAWAGIGCAAHSSDGAGHRWWNLRTPDRYVEAICDGRSPVAADDVVEGQALAHEAATLLLRTRDGVPAEAFAADDVRTGGVLDGLVEPAPGCGQRLRLTRRGRLLANEVSLRLRAPAPR